MWNLQIHPKAKMFLWRAARDILPHGSNLSRKGIENVGKCERCGLLETNSHVLKDCQWARDMWQNVMDVADIPHQVTFREWIGTITERRKQYEVEIFAVCAWQIWCARNDLCFEKIYITLDHCYKKATDLLEEFKRANISYSTFQNMRANVKWSPLELGYVKVNVDAAINLKEGRFGLGVKVRNSDGNLLLTASKTMWHF